MAVVVKGVADWFSRLEEGVTEFAEKYGVDAHVEFPATTDAASQLEIIDQLKTQGYDAIIVEGEEVPVLSISREDGADVVTHILSLTPFRRIVKDYYLICESYYDAIRSSTPSHIEAIDMGRRGLHNEGSQTLMDRLAGKIEIDFDTARRLFTLVCVLHWRG